jgi:hypothetical protein
MRRSMRRALQVLPGGDRLLQSYRAFHHPKPRYLIKYRGYVGGMWEEIGRVQFDFMVRQGLKPQDILVDVGCGSLRGGRFFIAYLDPEHYLGLDHHTWLIKAGLKHEVPKQLREEKRPQFVTSERFEFHRFGKRPNYGIAQSLFSHLTKGDIFLCLANLRAEMQSGGRFYATFVPKGFLPEDYVNPKHSDDHQPFQYDAEEILAIGGEAAWQARYIGDWGHPLGQQMLEFLAYD